MTELGTSPIPLEEDILKKEDNVQSLPLNEGVKFSGQSVKRSGSVVNQRPFYIMFTETGIKLPERNENENLVITDIIIFNDDADVMVLFDNGSGGEIPIYSHKDSQPVNSYHLITPFIIPASSELTISVIGASVSYFVSYGGFIEEK